MVIQMQRYALVNASGVVENVVVWDGGENWAVPEQFEAIQSDIACVGWTYANGEFSEPTPQPVQVTLAQAQAYQLAVIEAGYSGAVTKPISYTSRGGVTKSYQADSASQTVLMQAAQGYTLAGAVPSDFYWVSDDNTQVPFVLEDLSALYQAMLAQGWAAFQRKQSLKAQVNAATTVAAAQSITW